MDPKREQRVAASTICPSQECAIDACCSCISISTADLLLGELQVGLTVSSNRSRFRCDIALANLVHCPTLSET